MNRIHHMSMAALGLLGGALLTGAGGNKGVGRASQGAPTRLAGLVGVEGEAAEAGARALAAALGDLELSGQPVTLAGAGGAALAAGLRDALAKAKEDEVLALLLRVGARRGEDGLVLTDARGEDVLSVTALYTALNQSHARQTLLMVELLPAPGESVPPGLSEGLAQLRRAQPGVVLLRGDGLSEPSATCRGQSRGACALKAGLSAGADRDHDGGLSVEELRTAATARVKADGGAGGDLVVEGGAEGDWRLPIRASEPATGVGKDRPDGREPPVQTPPSPTITLCLSADGQPVGPEHVFQTGDSLGLRVSVPIEGYLSLANRGPTGNVTDLTADEQRGAPLRAGGVASFPADGSALTLDPPAGTEQLVWIWTRVALSRTEVEALAGRYGAALGASPGAVVVSSAPGRKDITLRPAPSAQGACTAYAALLDEDRWVMVTTLEHR